MTETEKLSAEKALRLWVDFKWALKIADHTYKSIAILAIKYAGRCDEEIPDRNIAGQAAEKYMQMAARCSEFDVEEEPETCPNCHLALFICPCPKPAS